MGDIVRTTKLRHGLWVDFDAVFTFSGVIVLSEALESSRSSCLVAPQFSRNCGQKFLKVQKSEEKFVRTTLYRCKTKLKS